MADAPSELPASMEETLESIDAQIAVLLEQVRQLRSKRNNITRISHIPDELLCKIFMEVKGERTTSYPTLQWIWVTHVCRRWRNAAIGFQDLWSDLDSRVGLPWLKVISARSKDVPISCIVASSGRKIIDFLSPTVQELGRITRLILQTNLIAANGLLRGAKGPASLLESLTLDHIGMNHATLPPAFLDIDAPQLKRIALIRCSPSRQWDTNIMKNATHIYLTETRFHPVFDFLEGLAGLRNLVELKLTKLTLDADTAAGETKVVTFPFLKKLHLHDHIVYCAYILKHCRLTRSTELQLDFNTSEDNALELLRSVLSELWMDELPLPNSATSPAPQALRLHLDRYYDETKFIFSGWNEISRQTLQPSEAPSFTIIFSLHVMPTDHISEIIHRIVRLLGWEDVCSLVLPDQLTADPFKDWSTVSVWFPKLQSIDLGHMTRTSFMEWLLSDPLLELIEEPTHDEPETSQATMHVVHVMQRSWPVAPQRRTSWSLGRRTMYQRQMQRQLLRTLMHRRPKGTVLLPPSVSRHSSKSSAAMATFSMTHIAEPCS
ncbi:hypothetical protein CC1G_08175 [Coprinopsis cinerea okayama7|uniref:Uncharacterized protein n=1 Tax=Coprinopsis cinerea (strain Okayama-7 / 130 / ATCC MYA-4618 / FGSC 9003) TaxID=240176 RepID=A8NZ72_COPC7|nr:hypothetical protein CC1G_08175 [Coprinopsis cinerea okayama7\|eukprot:XP_001837621.2 hypothetical protein CC1G_08175 [Coprinopsis cinerea okayama7\